MGAEQSSTTRDGENQTEGTQVKLCYYAVLGIDRLASDDEIKKAYRKKALKLHPDRNYGNVDSATEQFAEVQSAYQVLSDPQERAWYDAHRDAILRNDDMGAEDHFEDNIRLTSAGDIVQLISKFTSSIPFTDAPNGFYGILCATFETLAKEENAACKWQGLEAVEFPNFGTASDSYDLVGKRFYSVWSGFSTAKTYSWKEVYKYAEAPDRRVRRLMEKENKRLREEGIKEFNDAIRSLVLFVRKRDPRYTPNNQSELDRQKMLKEAAAAQAARARAANQAKIDGQLVPEWARTREAENEEVFSESELSDEQHYECLTCGKTFKSERQYDSHEKSKKHMKAVQQLRQQMQRENKRFHLDDTLSQSEATLGSASKSYSASWMLSPASIDDSESAIDSPVRSRASSSLYAMSNDEASAKLPDIDARRPPESHPINSERFTEDSDVANDKYAPREEAERRFTVDSTDDRDSMEPTKESAVEVLTTLTAATSLCSDDENEPQIKVGKAKAKRARKAARQELEGQASQTCAACNGTFQTRSALFNHIKENRHAQPHKVAVRKPTVEFNAATKTAVRDVKHDEVAFERMS
ncbi:MAG: hypothetical protein M1818_003130 [Claussenomyces sp. TS43310]|nr:MAG: hypothetical protein M1818_003130 [Claussenomyces sp. TS43310]